MKSRIVAVLLFSFSVLMISCHKEKVLIVETQKMSPNDPFKNTMVRSQFFDIDTKKDNIVEGEQGTIIICPKGCFINSDGEVVTENVRIELAEAYSTEDMLTSNLTTTSDGMPLETDGMIFFNATANGKQVAINKNKPVHAEMPTPDKKPDMMVFKGTRDENGNMNWTEPKAPDNFIKTVDIFSLDFLPEGFQREVEKGKGFNTFKTVTEGYTYHVYYSLSEEDRDALYIKIMHNKSLNETFDSENINEPSYNQQGNVIYSVQQDSAKKDNRDYLVVDSTDERKCGIYPAKIKAIRNQKYQNTFIATKEFELRLKVIFRTCENDILDNYVKNLDKNLFELDSIAAKMCKRKGLSEEAVAFEKFMEQRLTKVESADKYAALLSGYYDEQLKKIKAELKTTKDKFIEAEKKKDEEAQQVKNDYKKLLQKRETYRMETYGFNMTETGWVNIDNGTRPKEWGSEPLEIIVQNGKQFDRVYCYAYYPTIKSLSKLNSSDNISFHAGSESEKTMLMPKDKTATAISIGYKGELPFLFIRSFETGTDEKFSVSLEPSTNEKVKEALQPYNNNTVENNISKDLEFMTKFFEEKQRQNKIIKETEIMLGLWNIAFPCCAIDI